MKREGIFKDCYSEQEKDYNLRPNALIALVFLGHICDKTQIMLYLKNVHYYLIGKHSIGVRNYEFEVHFNLK